jgi:hypothetical protein
MVVGYGSEFRHVGVFVGFLGFGRERERSRCRGIRFFFPCLYASRGKRRTHSVVPNGTILGFFSSSSSSSSFF